MSNLLFIAEEHDADIRDGLGHALNTIKPFLGDKHTRLMVKSPEYMVQLEQYCDTKDISGIISSNQKFLRTFLPKTVEDKVCKLSNFAGSHFYHKFKSGREIEIVFSNPLEQLWTVSYGKYMIQKWISKLVTPKDWFPTPAFSWEVLTPGNLREVIRLMDRAFLVALDTETKKDPIRLDMFSVSIVLDEPDGRYSIRSFAAQIRTLEDVYMLRQIFGHPVRKVLQNGKYDAAYSSRYGAPLVNWLYDTKLLQYCWLAELPKDLAFLQALYVRTASYWKHLSESGDISVRMEYAARDTWATACACLSMIWQMPDFVYTNYEKKMPAMPPSHFCEMLGVRRDMDILQQEHDGEEKKIKEMTAHLEKCLGKPGFNTNSPVQVKQLMHVLGNVDLQSSNEKDMQKAMFRHPYNKYLLQQIIDIRGARKLHSTYFVPEKCFEGRVLYSLNPDGTDTGRNASSEHMFWCGLQIQNVPGSAKGSFIADDDFYIAECDLEQAESRGTGYFVGDENLIAAVESGKDFHSLNASAFFGYPYEEIFDIVKGKPRMKELRTLSKRVNHGANYYMMENTLIDTMGLEAIWEAKRLMNLPFSTPREIAHYLLEDCFGKTYPTVRYDYPKWVKEFVPQNGMLVGPQGWTRICFGDPRKNKLVLNALIAHNPQSLNAMSVDESFIEVFQTIQLHPDHRHNFRLLAQIHDSILFQYRKGHEYLCEMVRKIMEREITCTDISGKTRTFLVPAALKMGKLDSEGKLIRATSWSTTE